MARSRAPSSRTPPSRRSRGSGRGRGCREAMAICQPRGSRRATSARMSWHSRFLIDSTWSSTTSAGRASGRTASIRRGTAVIPASWARDAIRCGSIAPRPAKAAPRQAISNGRVVVPLVAGQPGAVRILGRRPLREQGGLAVAGGRDHGDDGHGAGGVDGSQDPGARGDPAPRLRHAPASSPTTRTEAPAQAAVPAPPPVGPAYSSALPANLTRGSTGGNAEPWDLRQRLLPAG